LAFSTCEDFTTAFDQLYQGRDIAKYPHWNPMRANPAIPVNKSHFIQFPTNYFFQRTIHGIDEFATMHDKVRVVSKISKCMHAANDTSKNVYMADCKAGSPNQDFYYFPSTREIKLRHNGLCLDSRSNGNVWMYACHGRNNQKWRYNPITQEVKNLESEKCLDMSSSSADNLYMNPKCHGGSNQKFVMPSQWLHAMTLDRVQVFSDPSKCMDVDDSQRLRMLPCDQKLNTTMCGNASVKQSDYRGTINVTSSGTTCQRWGSFPLTSADQNYCRNPDNDERAWRYTTNPSICFQYCNVPYCGVG
jgi:hypothetical protein